jgi:hypothetical protein
MTSTDPSAIESTTYIGQGFVTMYDRRVSNWVSVNAYLFNVVWDDGITSTAQVNPEFNTVASATIEAEKYAFLIGQLPHNLREDVNEIWIHKGVQPFGGGNNSILIHTGQSILYENQGIIEETLVHEASHTSLDATHAASAGWLNAQNLDNEFISTYAQNNSTSEDIAESFLTWLAVRYREDQISLQDYNNITQTIPNRLSYFDSINFDLYPFEDGALSTETFTSQNFEIYPNPVASNLNIKISGDDSNISFTILNILGQQVLSGKLNTNSIDVSNLKAGLYLIELTGNTKKGVQRFIKK